MLFVILTAVWWDEESSFSNAGCGDITEIKP